MESKKLESMRWIAIIQNQKQWRRIQMSKLASEATKL